MKANARPLRIPLLVGALIVAAMLPAAGRALAAPAAPNQTAPGAKADEKEPKIKGIVLNRPNGGFLGLTLEDHHFVLSFYNSKKKPTQVDVARATARWPVHYLPHDEFAVLNPNAEGTALTSPKFVRPPYAFKLYIFLFESGSDKSVEHYIIDFHQ